MFRSKAKKLIELAGSLSSRVIWLLLRYKLYARWYCCRGRRSPLAISFTISLILHPLFRRIRNFSFAFLIKGREFAGHKWLLWTFHATLSFILGYTLFIFCLQMLSYQQTFQLFSSVSLASIPNSVFSLGYHIFKEMLWLHTGNWFITIITYLVYATDTCGNHSESFFFLRRLVGFSFNAF